MLARQRRSPLLPPFKKLFAPHLGLEPSQSLINSQVRTPGSDSAEQRILFACLAPRRGFDPLTSTVTVLRSPD
jgi:hypothetical protein